ncbi:MAG: hypothetical protein HWQ41_06275 [Nostoc sp. NOS(2021)]|nr:hypothetical protein [Nostoc sp. NOS(2021)]MBN3894871.1 hypothetical protein [Nostoc sp. NOS(2021)]
MSEVSTFGLKRSLVDKILRAKARSLYNQVSDRFEITIWDTGLPELVVVG